MEEINHFDGLSEVEAENLLKQYGSNEFVKLYKFSALSSFLSGFKSPLIIILLSAAAVAGILDDWLSSVIIFVMVSLGIVLDFVNSYKSEKTAQALKEKVKITATVIRDRKKQEIKLSDIVPGDIVLLSPGDLVPADGEVLEARDFFINESSLTGESFPVEKNIGGQVLMGSSVTTGNAVMRVIMTGVRTRFGKIAESISKKEEPTEFDRGIKDFSFLILYLIIALVIFVFFVGAVFKHNFLGSFLFAIALAVGMSPELLPMIIAINLSKGSIVMSRHGIIVKKLSAIQNFGNMDILCTDKTGTLTEDKITLVKYIDSFGNVSEKVLRYAFVSSAYHASFKNPLDDAIKDFKTIDISCYKKIDEIPFDYIRRRESIVVDLEGRRMLVTKGAPEEIVKICSRYDDDGGSLDEKVKQNVAEQYDSLSSNGFRVLGVAIREIKEIKDIYSKDDEKEMTFVGFIAFLDPPKKTVTETLQLLEDYGVEIKILTGDNELVTKKIARDINLQVKGILLGSDIENMNDDALTVKVKETTIFARVFPNQKTRIIQALRKSGHVVGYLGDGINDAPSLKAADVGVSVNNAVDVAKDSADFILLRKSLRDLINGVIEGRKIFSNTMKYLMAFLSSNFGNMFSMAGASVFLPFLPMLPVQIILNNFLYDFSQFTISTDKVDREDILKPRRFNVAFLKKFMLVFGLVSSIFDFLTFGALYFVFKLSPSGFQTGWFIESLATQVFVIFIIRTKQSIMKSIPSKPLVFSAIGVVVVGWGILMTQVGKIFGFTPLSWNIAVSIIGIVLLYLICVVFVKKWFYKKFNEL